MFALITRAHRPLKGKSVTCTAHDSSSEQCQEEFHLSMLQ